MNNKIKKLNIMLFCGFLAIVFIANLMSKDVVFSPNENRNLSQKPEFSWDSLISHQYTSDFEDYVTDQFIVRDRWVEGKTLMERLLGKVENNGVYFGKNGMLIERLANVNKELVDRNVQYINKFAQSLNPDVNVDMMLIPGASAIMKDQLPYVSDDIDQLALIDEIASKMSERVQFVNVNQTFLNHNQEDIYFKTDHHFNIYGAGIAFEAYANALGLAVPQYASEVVSDGFLGTLGSQSGAYYNEKDEIVKIFNDENIEVYYPDKDVKDHNVYMEENLEVKDKYTYYLNGNHSMVNIKTNHPEKEKLLVIRDSYANIFTPYLLEDFSEITLVDLRYNKMPMSQYVAENDIDRVLIFYSGKNFMSDINFTFLK